MSNSSSFIDVHVYDGKWQHNITTRLSIQEKYTLFNWLLKVLNGVDCDAINGIKLVINNTQQQPNFDRVNCIYADDILAEICVKLINTPENNRIDTLKNIAEQMADMYRLGQCPQGRSTRLIQIYKYL